MESPRSPESLDGDGERGADRANPATQQDSEARMADAIGENANGTPPRERTLFARGYSTESGRASEHLVTSVRVEYGARYDVVSVRNRGNVAGQLVVAAGDGDAVAARLVAAGGAS